MATDLGESDLDRPAADEPAQNVERVRIKVGAEKGLRLEFARRVTDQNVADGNAPTGMVPYGGARDDLDIRSPRPYHPVTSRRRQRVFGLTRRCFSVG